ncbi:MAG TPA: EamA family transporter [Succinivibrionaceae bacterium]|nr:DMT family transporter [Succinivibrio sp.]HAR80485.1 EamA family transporter [Succinivibrionaceae bacterium]
MFELRQYSLLFITALIWGSGFIGQKLGMEHVSPFTFTFFRTLIGALFLVPFILVLSKVQKNGTSFLRRSSRKDLFLGSLACGLCLIAAESFQQFGLVYTDVSKASFITALYIIFVPLISVIIGKKISLKIWFSVALSVVGLYFLCMKGSFTLSLGDLLVLICAIIFAVHILVISYFVARVDGLMLSCGQFFAASFFGLIAMLIDGVPSAEALKLAAPAFIYCGIMSNGIAYTLQVIGQRGINAAIATLIMSLESVLGAILGVIFLDEHMSHKEIIGAIIMFSAVIIAQTPTKHILKGSRTQRS